VVSDSKLRNKLARECAKGGWSVQRLETEIQRLQPKREYGGRRLNRPDSLGEILARTERLTSLWIRWNGLVTESGHDSKKGGVFSKQLQATLKRQRAITLEMKKLHRQIAKLQNLWRRN
jgi:hypothetical protein